MPRRSENVDMSVQEIVYHNANPALQFLLFQNSLDVELYEYAVSVFSDQAELFRVGGVHHKQ